MALGFAIGFVGALLTPSPFENSIVGGTVSVGAGVGTEALLQDWEVNL